MDSVLLSTVMLLVLGVCAAFAAYGLGRSNGYRQGVQVYKSVADAQQNAINELGRVEALLREQIDLLKRANEARAATITAQSETIKILESTTERPM